MTLSRPANAVEGDACTGKFTVVDKGGRAAVQVHIQMPGHSTFSMNHQLQQFFVFAPPAV